MKTVTLSAHVEGESICLDEPFDLPADARLLITILPAEAGELDRLAWHAFSKTALARAYAEDEPDYPISLIRPRKVYERV